LKRVEYLRLLTDEVLCGGTIMRILTLVFIPALLVSCGGAESAIQGVPGTPITPVATGWQQGFVSGAGLTNPYQVFIPLNYNTVAKKWPVILYQHSIGERGTDNVKQLSIGLAPVLKTQEATWEAITIFPQVSTTEQARGGYIRVGMASLDSVMLHYNVDPTRISVTGISAGGVYSFEMLHLNPTRFSAFVPIAANDCPVCITGNTNSTFADAALVIAREMPTMGYWQFHGELDGNIWVGDARQISAAWKSVNPAAKYTEYKGALHDSWTQAYAEPTLIPWMLAQHR
jgi:predicted peptidase